MGTLSSAPMGFPHAGQCEPGRTTLLHPDKLQAAVAKEWPGVDVRVEGPKMVKVTALATGLDEEGVLSALKSVLAERLPADARFAAEVEKLAVTVPPRLRPLEFHVEFPELTAEHFANPEWVLRTLAGNVRLTAACVMEGEGARVIPFTVTAQVALKERLPVPGRDLVKGDVIAETDLTEAYVDVSRGSMRPVSTPDGLVGRRLRRAAPAFVPIVPGQVEVPKIVRRGQLVRLVMSAGGLEVTGQVIAKDDGGYGQMVDAVYPATKKRLRVRIKDASTVEYVQ